MSDLIDRETLRAAFLAEPWRPGQVLGQVLTLVDAAPRAATEADEERCPRCLFRWRYHGPNHEEAAPRAATEPPLDVRRVVQAITNVAARRGVVKDPPLAREQALASIFGYSTTIPNMDAQIAAEYALLAGGKEQPPFLLADVTVEDLVEAWKLPDPIDHIWFMATDTCLCGAKVPDSAWFERHRAEAVLGRLRAIAGARALR